MGRTIRLADLDQRTREFLTDLLQQGGVVIEDDDGRSRGSVVPWASASVEERESASDRIRVIAKRTREQMEAEGRTEEELDRILQEN